MQKSQYTKDERQPDFRILPEFEGHPPSRAPTKKGLGLSTYFVDLPVNFRTRPRAHTRSETEGFQRIRYYGFLANRYREHKLAHCRDLLGMPAPEPAISKAGNDYRDRYEQLTGSSLSKCPVCRQGRMLMIEILPRSPYRCLTPIKDTLCWRRLLWDPDPTVPHKLGRTKRGENRCQTHHPEKNLRHRSHSPDLIKGHRTHRDPENHGM